MTKQIKLHEFEANCRAVVDEVARTGEKVLITRDGAAVAELIPRKQESARSPFGIWKDAVTITGDIVSPADDSEWNALK